MNVVFILIKIEIQNDYHAHRKNKVRECCDCVDKENKKNET